MTVVERELQAGVIDRLPVNFDHLNVNFAIGQLDMELSSVVAVSVDRVPVKYDLVRLSCDLFPLTNVCLSFPDPGAVATVLSDSFGHI